MSLTVGTPGMAGGWPLPGNLKSPLLPCPSAETVTKALPVGASSAKWSRAASTGDPPGADLAVGPRLPGDPFDRVITVVHFVHRIQWVECADALGTVPAALVLDDRDAREAVLAGVHAGVVPGVDLGIEAGVGRTQQHGRPWSRALGNENVRGKPDSVAKRQHHEFVPGPGWEDCQHPGDRRGVRRPVPWRLRRGRQNRAQDARQQHAPEQT